MQILWIAEKKGREYIPRLEASQQGNVQHLGLSMYMYRKNGWPRRKLEGCLCADPVIPSHSVAYGFRVFLRGFLYHTSNTAVLPRGGEETENGARNTVTRAGILILKGCEI